MQSLLRAPASACVRSSCPTAINCVPSLPCRAPRNVSCSVAAPAVESPSTDASAGIPLPIQLDHNQHVREGHYEAELVRQQVSHQVAIVMLAQLACIAQSSPHSPLPGPPSPQADKVDDAQPLIASALPRPDMSKQYDAAIVGAGPAGMILACELAKRGLSTVIIGGCGATGCVRVNCEQYGRVC